jgi:hypothetical protein
MTNDHEMTSEPGITSDPGMTSEKIDRILASEEALMPSSGFLSSIMERIHDEAAAPKPIPFPWKRAVPGMVLAAGIFGWGAFELVRHGMGAAGRIAISPPHLSAALERPLEQAGWVALALGVSWLSWLFSRMMAGRSGLL